MTGPALALVGLALGILGGDALGPGPARGIGVLGIALLIGAFRRRAATRRALALLAVGAVLLGVTVEQRALHGLAVSPVSPLVAAGRVHTVEVALTEDPAGSVFATEALGRLVSIVGGDAGGRTVLLHASGDEQSALRVLEAGDRLLVRGRFGELSGYSTRLRWRHAVGRFDVEEVRAVGGPSSLLARVANGARHAVTAGARDLPGTPRALLAGFVLGDTRAIPADLVADFRAAGLSHLLAVSGANVAFALAIVAPLLARLPLRARFGGGIAVLVVFGTMTRWEPSVARASVMAGVVMLARLLGRPADARRVLLLAVTGLLTLDPFLLHSVGFLLSCGACAGIVVTSGAVTARLPGPTWFREALGVTTAAQMGVAPVLLAVFGSLPLVALPANVLAAPLVGPLTVWGLVGSAVGGVLDGPIGVVIQLPTLALLRGVEGIARTAAGAPVAIDRTVGVVLAGMGALGWGVRIAVRTWGPGFRSYPLGRVGGRGRRVSREGQRPGPARP